MATKSEWINQLRDDIEAITPREAAEAHARGELLLVDVRESDEVRAARVPGALHIPRGYLELRAEERLRDKNQVIVTYCAGGIRSLFAADALRQLGYQQVRSLEGGFGAWKAAGLPFEEPETLDAAEQRRYARQIVIPEVGEEGQSRLRSARVLLVGAGGLGSPAAIYLAAAGVGTLRIVDFDVVEESNLHRQILHDTASVGDPKVESARRTLRAINPHVRVEAINERLTPENASRLLEGQDVIVDGSDNFETRYLVNDRCVEMKIPNVHGSIFRFDGQVTVFWPPEGPCYRCLYAAPPPPELAPT